MVDWALNFLVYFAGLYIASRLGYALAVKRCEEERKKAAACPTKRSSAACAACRKPWRWGDRIVQRSRDFQPVYVGCVTEEDGRLGQGVSGSCASCHGPLREGEFIGQRVTDGRTVHVMCPAKESAR